MQLVLFFFLLLQSRKAQVAELVDAMVSNTIEVTLMPVRSRPWVPKKEQIECLLFFYVHSPQLTLQIILHQLLYIQGYLSVFAMSKLINEQLQTRIIFHTK